MAKSVHNDVLDASMSYISANADKAVICSAQPTSYAEAVNNAGGGGYALADYVPSFTGPADGDASGRKLTVDAETGITVDDSGTGNHIALVKTGTSTLLYVTTITSPQPLVAGNTADLTAWDVEIADPS